MMLVAVLMPATTTGVGLPTVELGTALRTTTTAPDAASRS